MRHHVPAEPQAGGRVRPYVAGAIVPPAAPPAAWCPACHYSPARGPQCGQVVGMNAPRASDFSHRTSCPQHHRQVRGSVRIQSRRDAAPRWCVAVPSGDHPRGHMVAPMLARVRDGVNTGLPVGVCDAQGIRHILPHVLQPMNGDVAASVGHDVARLLHNRILTGHTRQSA